MADLPLQAVVDAYHAQVNVAIYASLAIFIFHGYCFGGPVADLARPCNRMFAYVHHTASSEVHPVSREHSRRRSLRTRDEYEKSSRCLPPSTRSVQYPGITGFFCAIQLPLLWLLQARVVLFYNGLIEDDVFHDETIT